MSPLILFTVNNQLILSYCSGFDAGDILPPLCPFGTFCPDEGSGCQALLPFGQTCQKNKDDQCAPAVNWQELSSELNVNGSICLLEKCRYVITDYTTIANHPTR